MATNFLVEMDETVYFNLLATTDALLKFVEASGAPAPVPAGPAAPVAGAPVNGEADRMKSAIASLHDVTKSLDETAKTISDGPLVFSRGRGTGDTGVGGGAGGARIVASGGGGADGLTPNGANCTVHVHIHLAKE